MEGLSELASSVFQKEEIPGVPGQDSRLRIPNFRYRVGSYRFAAHVATPGDILHPELGVFLLRRHIHWIEAGGGPAHLGLNKLMDKLTQPIGGGPGTHVFTGNIFGPAALGLISKVLTERGWYSYLELDEQAFDLGCFRNGGAHSAEAFDQLATILDGKVTPFASFSPEVETYIPIEVIP